MQLTNTWRHRLSTAGRGGAKFIVAILVASAALNGLSIVWRWVFPAESTPVAQTARTVGNQTALVESYAIDCVTVLLTASSSRAAEVARCFPDATDMALPTTPPLIVSAQSATATLVGQSAGDVATYGVVVAVTEQPYTNAPPTRGYYQLPVSVYGGSAPRAMAKPARRDPPPPGVEVSLDYPVTITNNAALASVISGFITCYLTDAAGIERFVTVDSGLGQLRAYSSATVSAIRAQNQPPEVPAEGAQLRVWVAVSARAADYSTTPLEYPLTLRATGGAWSVAGVDPVPAIDPDAPPVPVGGRPR
ncbi:conjugal transfer protein [Mycolicibacterium conceptionense]|uniref:conjugal transfer protein n=1 Tax=Mycolicibacterium conceptionense TaxID=451644 RepID=UPI003204E46B